MAACIPKSTIDELLRKVAKKEEIQRARNARINIWDITDADVDTMLKNGHTGEIDAKKLDSNPIRSKLDSNLKYTRESTQEFITKLQAENEKGASGTRLRAIGLHTVFEQLKGEVDKARRDGIDINTMTEDGFTPYMPLHRVAATIGRKALYLKGYTVTKFDKDVAAGEAIEAINYDFGMKILQELEKQGFIKMHEKDTPTIKDYLETINDERSYDKDDLTTTDNPAFSLNLSALGFQFNEEGNPKTKTDEEAIRYFTDRANSKVRNHPVGEMAQVLKAVTLLSEPSYLSLPSLEKPDTAGKHRDDVYKRDPTMREATKDVAEAPVYIDETLHDFMELLAEEVNAGAESASAIMRDLLVNQKGHISGLFKQDMDNRAASQRESVKGRNRSSATPFDDLVEYFGTLAGKGKEIFLDFFAGRNGRMYYDNSVLNGQTSKIMRHTFAVKPYSMKTDSDQAKWMIGKLAHTLGVDPDYIMGNATPDQQLNDLDAAVAELQKFKDGKELVDKAEALSKMRKVSPGMDYAELVTTLQAVKDVRDSLDGGVLKTSWVASSDATASGGMLSLIQALGTNPAIKELLQEMGILKGKQKSLPDVYHILKRHIDTFIDTKKFEGVEIELEDPALAHDTITMARDMLFKDVRDMAKKPTMVFIYGQSKNGAVRGISEDLSDRVIERLKAGRRDVIEIINLILPPDAPKYAQTKADVDKILRDPQMMTTLRDAFENSGMPALMYDTLKGAVTNRYLKRREDTSKAIFSLLQRYNNLKDMKVLPASAALHFGEPESKTHLEEYGVPLQKQFEVRHDTYAPVLTREGKLTQTVMDVSQIHTADTSAAYRAVKGLPQKHDSGVVIVHDDIRGSVPLVMEAETNYINEVRELGMNYDIHEQVLLAAAKYDNKIAQDPEYIKLKAQVDEAIVAKREALKDFNEQTDTIIGDKLPEVTLPGKAAVDTDTAVETDTATGGLEALAGDSEIIASFIREGNQAKVDEGTAKFEPNTDTISIPKGQSHAKTVELAEHEIIHSWTTAAVAQYYQDGGSEALGYKTTKQSNYDIAYVEKSLKRLAKVDIDSLPADAADAVSNILAIESYDTAQAVAELISVLSAEPKVAEAIYGAVRDKGNLKKVIERLLESVRKVLSKVSYADYVEKGVDVEKLQGAVNGAISAGKDMRQQNYEAVRELQTGFGDLFHRTPVENDIGLPGARYVDAVNNAVARRLISPGIRQTGGAAVWSDRYLKTHFPAYRTARDKISGIYETSTDLQQLVHTITNENINKAEKNMVLSAFAKVRAEKNEVINTELGRFAEETAKLTKKEKQAFYQFTHSMPLHDYFTMMESQNITDFAAKATELGTKFRKEEVKVLNAIVDMRLHGKTTPDTKYSISQIVAPNSDRGLRMRQYIVAKTIAEVGQTEWDNFAGNTALLDVTRDASLANAMLNDQQSNAKLGDTLVKDEPENPIDIRAVKREDMWKYNDEEKNGWIVYQSPEGNKPGIVYKKVIDQTYMEGAFTDIKYHGTDVDVNPNMRGMEGVVRAPNDEYKLVLTPEQKQELGVVNDAEQGLVRSMAHAMAIQDSQNIRDRLLQKETYFDLDKNPHQLLLDRIGDKEIDHPWFLGGKVDYDKLDPKIRAKYKPVHGKMSDVEGFNDKIKYVRKDIEHWLVGKRERSLFNDPKLQWATRITKDLVATAKISMVILNPLKIVGDNVSNLAYLGVRGVDPLYAQKQYRAISKEFHDYQDKKNAITHLRVRAIAEPNKEAPIKKKIKKLEQELKRHPANGIVDRGFLNSLGSDIVLRAGDPASGLKSDMDTVLKALFTSKHEENNAAGKLLMKMANWNIGLDQFLEIFAKVPGSVDSTKNVEAELLKISKRLKHIKTQDDAVAYMHQYLNSPDSEFVKMGTYMTDLSDVLAKETLYRYLTDKGTDPKKAELDVIDSFPNYNENLPPRVKQLSDVGILMFPSFWLRIQRAIYRMAKDRPVSFGTEMAIEEALGVDASTIWDANIWNKATSNYGLLHTPWEHIGMQSIFPVHAI